MGRVGGKNANGYSVDCGSSKWQQLFTYDPFGNIAKSGTLSFIPGYSATQNQFTSIPGVTVSYDSNGNLLTDNLNTYTWDVYGHMSTVNTGSTTVTATYDALDRVVEQYNGSAYTETLYSPLGKTALMNGLTLVKAFVNLPGGATAVYNSSGLAYYRHSDHLGSSRLASTPARGLYSSTAYAPFGEPYTTAGTADASFTGQNQDTVSSLYDFTFREHSHSQGRWISPDPLGVGAVDPTNPQTWNRYAYVANNPLSHTDPLGLDVDACDPESEDCSDPGGGPGPDPGSGPGTVGGDPNNGTTPCPNGPPCQVTVPPVNVSGDPPGAVPGDVSFLSCGFLGVCQGGGPDGGASGPCTNYVQICGGGAANNGRQPNNITCGTVLPNGRTVGSYVNQLSNTINNAPQNTSTPYGPSASYAPGYSPLSIPGQVYSGTNFRGMFGNGAGYTTNAFLGDAGNFAYAAVSANIGVPYLATELAAAAYSWTHHSPSDWVGPYGMDPSATVQVPAGYGASCKGY